MATSAQRRQEIAAGAWDGPLGRLYGRSEEVLARQRARWCAALDGFERYFGRKADKKRKLYNGMIQCNLFMYF